MTAPAQATTDEATGAPSFEDVRRLLEEYGIELIAKSAYPKPGQTRAPGTVQKIWRRYGEAHIRMVLSTLAETANNGLTMDEVGLWAASDMVRVCREEIEKDASGWLALFDAIPVGDLQVIAAQMAGLVPQRFALGGMLFERVHRRFGPNADQAYLFDDRGPYGDTA